MELNRGIIDLGIYSLFDGTAKYKRSFTYKDLKKNWLDDRSIPSEKAIKDAYMLEIEKINRQNKKLLSWK